MGMYGRWRITLTGEEHVWDIDEILGSEWLALQTELGGMSIREWIAGVDRRDFIPCQVLIWFLRRKAGRQEDRMAVDFPIFQLQIVSDEVDDDPEAPAAPDAATEQPSPTGTESGPGNGTA